MIGKRNNKKMLEYAMLYEQSMAIVDTIEGAIKYAEGTLTDRKLLFVSKTEDDIAYALVEYNKEDGKEYRWHYLEDGMLADKPRYAFDTPLEAWESACKDTYMSWYPTFPKTTLQRSMLSKLYSLRKQAKNAD